MKIRIFDCPLKCGDEYIAGEVACFFGDYGRLCVFTVLYPDHSYMPVNHDSLCQAINHFLGPQPFAPIFFHLVMWWERKRWVPSFTRVSLISPYPAVRVNLKAVGLIREVLDYTRRLREEDATRHMSRRFPALTL